MLYCHAELSQPVPLAISPLFVSTSYNNTSLVNMEVTRLTAQETIDLLWINIVVPSGVLVYDFVTTNLILNF